MYSSVAIIVIIYHYSCRERKIVSTDDTAASVLGGPVATRGDGETLACKMWV